MIDAIEVFACEDGCTIWIEAFEGDRSIGVEKMCIKGRRAATIADELNHLLARLFRLAEG
jgi:hypothetical protein